MDPFYKLKILSSLWALFRESDIIFCRTEISDEDSINIQARCALKATNFFTLTIIFKDIN